MIVSEVKRASLIEFNACVHLATLSAEHAQVSARKLIVLLATMATSCDQTTHANVYTCPVISPPSQCL